MVLQPTVANLTHDAGVGTLGAILRDRRRPAQLYALTAGHVLAADDDTAGYDLVGISGGDGGIALQGALANWVPNFAPHTGSTTTDAAIARVDADALADFATYAAAWPSGSAIARRGDALRLLTRNRGPIDGIALGYLSCDMSIASKGLVYTLNSVQAWHAPGLAQRGDSGAPVWNDQDQLVGIHVGTAPGAPDQALLIPIYRILEYFKADLVVRNEPLTAPAMAKATLKSAPAPTAEALIATAAAVAVPLPAHADTLARTLWGEARGERDAEAGMRAVAHVVLNRTARRTYWGKTVTEVCRKPYQFSCWNTGDPNLPKLLDVLPDDPQFKRALDIATALLSDARGLVPAQDPTRGATHYHARTLQRWPRWAVGHTPCAAIGQHVFYNDIA